MAWMALGLWVGSAWSESISWYSWCLASGIELRGLLPVVVVVAVSVVVGVTRRWLGLVLLAAGLIAGLMAGQLYWARWAHDARVLDAADSRGWDAEVVSDPRQGRFSERSEVLVKMPHGSARVSVSWPDGPPPEAGRQVRFFGVMKMAGVDEFGRRSHQSGVCASVSARAVRDYGWHRGLRGLVGPVRTRAREVTGRVPGPGGALLDGVVLGDRRRLAGTQAESDFRTTGLTHLVAVSGSHLVVVAALLTWFLGVARVPRVPSRLLVITIVGLYVITTGVQASAVRAWAMAGVATGASLSGRRADGLGAVCVAIVAAVAAWPPVAFDLGFQLSVLAVAGLVTFSRLAAAWTAAAIPRAFAPLAPPIALTLTAQAVTMPLTVSTFGAWSMISPVANLLAGPLVSGVLTLGLVGVALSRVAAPAGELVLHLSGSLGALTATVASRLAAVPYASIPLGALSSVAVVAIAGAVVAVWAWWPAPRKRGARGAAVVACAFSILVAIGPPAPGGISLVVLDVGQGDAILVRDGPRALLVDTGPDAASLRAALARFGIRRLDALALTHAHEDHTGGTAALVRAIPVGRVLTARGAAAPLREILSGLDAPVSEVQAGARLRLGDVDVEVVSPPGPVSDPSENNSSLVLLVRAKGFQALLTGDAESEVLEPLAASGAVGDIDVLKVGHHGSADAVSPPSLAVLRPEVALISVGAGNRFGHPVASTVTLLESSGSRVLRTDRAGDLVISVGTRRWRLETRGRGTVAGSCATLAEASFNRRATSPKGAHEYLYNRSQADLSDHQRAGVLAAACPGQAQGSRLGSRGHRLQLRGVRGRECLSGRDHGGLQHLAVCVRAPPGGGTQRREALERGHRCPDQVRRGPISHHGSGFGCHQARQEHQAVQGRGEAGRSRRAQDPKRSGVPAQSHQHGRGARQAA
ncbi:MAG: DNA internalization-related competence protein ComEC/Rec2 [Actinobacteria bacterium HGW-Actinobacteria-7]|nr:MAG: DNA internalization-related competence protein ComEC/Rec2 [Actinobacteria bacterium HGW-Actinobacteria-7]